MVVLFLVVLLVPVLLLAWRHKSPSHPVRPSVAIVVLGDFGRSPRMMYHAQSFVENGFDTFVIAYQGSALIPALRNRSQLHLLYLPELPKSLSPSSSRLFVVFAFYKVLFQISTILFTLLFRLKHAPQFILLQNPPSIPTLPIAQVVCWLRGSKLIIDWHNLGYSILALKLGSQSPLVLLAKRLEMCFGRSAHAHLFVTSAMKDHLTTQWHLQGQKILLYDRPPSQFHRCSPSEVHHLFTRLTTSIHPLVDTILPSYSLPASTPFTFTSSTSYSLRQDRPALIVSSTSWTDDEDFNVLLTALQKYEQSVRNRSDLPNALVIITGKGPLKSHYMDKISDLESSEQWRHVRCRSVWLEPEQYPLLLGSADLGICLHASSSSLDLPMKVVDMFGCRLPVLALDFKCLPELVIDGKNGRIFRTADDLANLLVSTLSNLPNSTSLQTMRTFLDGTSEWDWCSWTENWNRVLLPAINNRDQFQVRRI